MADYSKAETTWPVLPTDKIVYTDTGTITISNTTGLVGTLNRIPLRGGTPSLVYAPEIVGVYSYDGGTTWIPLSPFDTSLPAISGVSVRVNGRVDRALGSLSADFVIYVDSTVGGGSTISIQVKFAIVVSKDNIGYMEVDHDYGQNTALDSRKPVPRIAKEDRVLSDGTSYVIPHDVGAVPDVIAYYTYNSGYNTTQRFYTIATAPAIYADASNLYINSINQSGYNITYRIYYP